MSEKDIIDVTTEIDDNIDDPQAADLELDEEVVNCEYGRGEDNDYPDPLGEDE